MVAESKMRRFVQTCLKQSGIIGIPPKYEKHARRHVHWPFKQQNEGTICPVAMIQRTVRLDVANLEPAVEGNEKVSPLPVCPLCNRHRSGRTYEIIKRLGEGSFGEVSLVEELTPDNRWRLGQRWALKWISLGSKKQALHVLQQEAHALQLLEHPNIVRFYDEFTDSPNLNSDAILPNQKVTTGPFRVGLVMEFCPNGDLSDIAHLIEFTPIPENVLTAILYQVCSALHCIHSHGFVHRDIKPHNLMISQIGDIKVGDLGIAKEIHNPGDRLTGTFAGTPAYISPEVHDYQPYAFPADIWCLGAVLLELGSGVSAKKRFLLERQKPICLAAEDTHFLWAQEFRSRGYSEELINILMQLLCRDPEQRPAASAVLSLQLVISGSAHFDEMREYLLQMAKKVPKKRAPIANLYIDRT